jgi:hypothetical protein
VETFVSRSVAAVHWVDCREHGGGSVAGPQGAEGFKRGTPLDEATPERREQWLAELQKQGKYTEGASLKELIEKRDGEKTGSEGE